MSFQAYIDNIKQKTGKSPEDFKKLASAAGLLQPGVKTMQIVAWLKSEFGLGHGHAMAIVSTLEAAPETASSPEERIAAHFSGSKAQWLAPFESYKARVTAFGDDVSLKGGGSYLTFLRNEKKFVIVVVGSAHMDIGIKLKGVAPTERFEEAGKWNAMVTHRVRVSSAEEIDEELISWANRAYLSVNPSRS